MKHLCLKWPLGVSLNREVKRVVSNSAAVTTVVQLTCPHCGWSVEDYEIEDVPGKQCHERDLTLRAAQQRRYWHKLRYGKAVRP